MALPQTPSSMVQSLNKNRETKVPLLELRIRTHYHQQVLDQYGLFSVNSFTDTEFTRHRVILLRCIDHGGLAYFQSCAISRVVTTS